MRESFSEYKVVLERCLISAPYLYDGDINFSTDKTYTEILNTPLTSPKFIMNSISHIYDESIEHLKKSSKEIIIPEESVKLGKNWQSLNTDKIIEIISSEIGVVPNYIFSSKNSYHKCGFDNSFNLDTTRPLPSHFYRLTKLTGLNTEIFYSPNVEDEDGQFTLYATDRSFQSLVYSIQNMEYKISIVNQDDITNNKPYHEINWKHTMEYKFYDCKFKSVKVLIKNISKLREDKINIILDGN